MSPRPIPSPALSLIRSAWTHPRRLPPCPAPSHATVFPCSTRGRDARTALVSNGHLIDRKGRRGRVLMEGVLIRVLDGTADGWAEVRGAGRSDGATQDRAIIAPRRMQTSVPTGVKHSSGFIRSGS